VSMCASNGKARAAARSATGNAPSTTTASAFGAPSIFAVTQLYLHALVPRIDCPEHVVTTVAVPWSTGRSEFTSRFERLAIALLLEMSVAAVARRLGIGWDAVEGIMMRAVERGLQRRIPRIERHLGIDEKSVKKRHRYFTIVSDLDRGEVLWAGRGRKRESIDAFYHQLSDEQRAGIEGVAMDSVAALLRVDNCERTRRWQQDRLRQVSHHGISHQGCRSDSSHNDA
jgi:hypothetical protein